MSRVSAFFHRLPWSSTRSTAAKATAARFRPRVEGLEDRSVPAADYWMGFVGGNPTWSLGHGPSYGDDVYFDGGYSNDSVTVGVIGPWNSIHPVNGYSGTVTLNSSIWVSTFEQTSGTLYWMSAGEDVNVSSSFTFTSGTLNSSSNLNTVHLNGATALIDPGGGTVTTGNTISFENGATGTFSPGTVNYTNSAAFTVAAGCFVTLDGSLGDVTFIQDASCDDTSRGDITVKGGATLGGRVSNYGTYRFMDKANVNFDGGSGVISAYLQARAGGGIVPTTYIENESKLTFPASFMEIRAGHLSTLARAGGTVPTATIDGKLTVSQDTGQTTDIQICTGSSPHVFGTLNVTGDITWNAGTFYPVVNASSPPQADKWITSRKFTVGANAQLSPVTINIPPGGMPANQVWLFLQAGTDGIVGTAPAVIGGVYTVSPSGTPVTQWYFAT